ncbi:MAG: CDP-alcohol phosphatidyltransferase family protein [Patescibacteria group bacterium]
MKRWPLFLQSIVREFFSPPAGITVHHRLLTVPNIVTSFGLVLAGIHALFLLTQQNEKLIPLVFLTAVLTDAADGFLARRLDQHSYAGKILDPVRDRILGLLVIVNIALTLPVWRVAWLIDHPGNWHRDPPFSECPQGKTAVCTHRGKNPPNLPCRRGQPDAHRRLLGPGLGDDFPAGFRAPHRVFYRDACRNVRGDRNAHLRIVF